MDTRKENLLLSIIEEYIKTAEPIGSKIIAQSGRFDVSPATIRNEMVDLEREGYIYQPYTSAGRIPTDEGYSYYVRHFVGPEEKLILREKENLERAISEHPDRPLKSLAKGMAEISGQAVIIGFSQYDTFYTGLSNLFSQPEFENMEYLCHISSVIDHLDEALSKVYETIENDIRIFIGKGNPFGLMCSTFLTRYMTKDSSTGVIGFLGPTRMDYKKNYGLLAYGQEAIQNILTHE